MEVSKRRRVAFSASDEVIPWVESITGLLTLIDTKYGGLSEMLESPAWDESKTDYTMRLVKALSKRVARLEKEFLDHAQNKRY
jgi:hypothetical protein